MNKSPEKNDSLLDISNIDLGDDDCWLSENPISRKHANVDPYAVLNQAAADLNGTCDILETLFDQFHISSPSSKVPFDSRTFTRTPRKVRKPVECVEQIAEAPHEVVNFQMGKPVNDGTFMLMSGSSTDFQNMSPPSLINSLCSSTFANLMDSPCIKDDPELRKICDTDFTRTVQLTESVDQEAFLAKVQETFRVESKCKNSLTLNDKTFDIVLNGKEKCNGDWITSEVSSASSQDNLELSSNASSHSEPISNRATYLANEPKFTISTPKSSGSYNTYLKTNCLNSGRSNTLKHPNHESLDLSPINADDPNVTINCGNVWPNDNTLLLSRNPGNITSTITTANSDTDVSSVCSDDYKSADSTLPLNNLNNTRCEESKNFEDTYKLMPPPTTIDTRTIVRQSSRKTIESDATQLLPKSPLQSVDNKTIRRPASSYIGGSSVGGSHPNLASFKKNTNSQAFDTTITKSTSTTKWSSSHTSLNRLKMPLSLPPKSHSVPKNEQLTQRCAQPNNVYTLVRPHTASLPVMPIDAGNAKKTVTSQGVNLRASKISSLPRPVGSAISRPSTKIPGPKSVRSAPAERSTSKLNHS